MNFELEVGNRTLSIETEKVAKQASGAVTVRYGDTVVLVTAVCGEPRDTDFLPLLVEYREQAYAAGKIPGGFFKREGRPSSKEILSARLIDRPIRTLFPEHFRNDVQIVAIVLSFDQANDGDILAVIGASAALSISEIPFTKPIGCVRIGKVKGEFVINPTVKELDESELDLVIAGTKNAVIMMEAGAKEVSEEAMIQAIELGHKEIIRIVELGERVVSQCGVPKLEYEVNSDNNLIERIENLTAFEVEKANQIADKRERKEAFEKIFELIKNDIGEEVYLEKEKEVKASVEEIARRDMRKGIVEEGKRVDGRASDEIRSISCEVGSLPRTHGSALFTRGQTQCLVVTTLGTSMDEQIIDDLEGATRKSFMLHYNFPPFSVGEVRPIRGPGRREIGHGALAERALENLIPSDEVFPYTIRIVSDILESNGSSSMATICGSSLSLMDAGIPIKTSVAGISIGLVKEKDKEVLLSDIIGLEDHFGDMDFKVAGTRDGITAIQLDTKIDEVSIDTLERAIQRAKEGRDFILDVMDKTIGRPRDEISVYAPRIRVIDIPKEKIGELIGPGGKTIRGIIDTTGAKIDIDDVSGKVTVAAVDAESGEQAVKIIEEIIQDIEVGRIYVAKVKKITSFGAIVDLPHKKEGLIHISQLAPYRVKNVRDVVKEGDEVAVKVRSIDEQGKISLSRRDAAGSGKPDRRNNR